METKTLPRGIRNNNPLNIRIGNKWIGEVESPTDKEFEQFVSMVYGLRAGFILLRRYINRYHLNTVRDIISRWAPPTENNTTHYCCLVAARMNIGVLDVLDYDDEETMVQLVSAMCYVECGCEIDKEQIHEGYKLANQ